MGLKCPECGSENQRAIDSRPNADANMIRRRRECLDCGYRFTTHEAVNILPRRKLIEEIKEVLMVNIGEAIRKTVEELEDMDDSG